MNPTKTGDELRCFGRVSMSGSTSGTRRVVAVTNPVIRWDRCDLQNHPNL